MCRAALFFNQLKTTIKHEETPNGYDRPSQENMRDSGYHRAGHFYRAAVLVCGPPHGEVCLAAGGVPLVGRQSWALGPAGLCRNGDLPDCHCLCSRGAAGDRGGLCLWSGGGHPALPGGRSTGQRPGGAAGTPFRRKTGRGVFLQGKDSVSAVFAGQ